MCWFLDAIASLALGHDCLYTQMNWSLVDEKIIEKIIEKVIEKVIEKIIE